MAKGYIVRRLIRDGHAGGADEYAYKRVETPNPGELIYHGDFVPDTVEDDMKENGTVLTNVYRPVDPSKIASEPYKGSSEVETF